MALNEKIMRKIAGDTGISMEELTTSGITALLRERRRKIMLERLDILARYNITSPAQLENNIKEGDIAEHPTWEDLILLENLDEAINLIDEDINVIQEAA
jgi:replication initiation and membrane attachment protein DnaB